MKWLTDVRVVVAYHYSKMRGKGAHRQARGCYEGGTSSTDVAGRFGLLPILVSAAMATGELAVTTPLGLGRIILIPIIEDFLKTYPDIKVRMIPTDQKLSLAQQQIDVAVRIGELPDSSLVAVRVSRTRRVVCARPAYLAARGTPRAPEDLVGDDCISYAGFSLPDAWTFVRDKATITALVHTRLIVRSAEAACAAAAPA